MSNSNYNYNLKMGYRLMGQYKLPSIPLFNIGILDNSSNSNEGYYNQSDNNIFNIKDYLNNDLFMENQTPCKIKLETKIYDYTTKNYNIKSYQSDAIFFDNLKKNPTIDADYGIIFNEDSNTDISFCFGVPNIKRFKFKPYNLSYMNINSKQRYLHSISGENIISKLKIYDSSNTPLKISYTDINVNETGNYDIDNSNNEFESDIITPDKTSYENNINTNKFYIEHSSFSLLNMQSKSGYNQNNILSFENYYDPSLNNLRQFLNKYNIRLLELNFEGIKQFLDITDYKDKINDISNILFQNPIEFIKNKTKEITDHYDLSFTWIIQRSNSGNIKVLNHDLSNRITNHDISQNTKIIFDLSSNQYVLTHPFYYNITDSSNNLFLQFLYLYYYKYSFDISINNNISYNNLSIQDIQNKLKDETLELNTMNIKLNSKLSFLHDKLQEGTTTMDNIQDISYIDITDTYDKYYYKKKRWTPVYFNGVFHQLNNVKDTFIDNPNFAYYHNYNYKHNHDEDNYNGLFDDLPYFERTNWIGFKVPFVKNDKVNNIITISGEHFFNVNIFKTIIPNISNILSKQKHCYVSVYNPVKKITFTKELYSGFEYSSDSLWYIKDDINNIYYKSNENAFGFLVNSKSPRILDIYNYFTIFFAVENPVNDICKNNINVTENRIIFTTNSNKIFNINLNKKIPSFEYNNLSTNREIKNIKSYKDITLTVNNDNTVVYTSDKKHVDLQNVQYITNSGGIKYKIYFDNEMFEHEEFELFKNNFLLLDINDTNFSEMGKILVVGKEFLEAYASMYTYLEVEFSKDIDERINTIEQSNQLKKKKNKYKVTYIGKKTLEYKSHIYYINLKKKYLLLDINTIDTIVDTTFVIKEKTNENIVDLELEYGSEKTFNILYGKIQGDKYKIYYEPEITMHDISKQNVLYILKYTIDYEKIKYKENIFDYHSENNKIKFINDNDVSDNKFLNKKKIIKSNIIRQDVPLHKYDYYQSLRDAGSNSNTIINEIKMEDNILYINDTKYIDNSGNTIYNHYLTYDILSGKSYSFRLTNCEIVGNNSQLTVADADANYDYIFNTSDSANANVLSFEIEIEIKSNNNPSISIHFKHKTDVNSSTTLDKTTFDKEAFDTEINNINKTPGGTIDINQYTTTYKEYIKTKIYQINFGENLIINQPDSTIREQNVRNNLITTENNYQSNTQQQENLYLDTTTYTSMPGSSSVSMPTTTSTSYSTSTSTSTTTTSTTTTTPYVAPSSGSSSSGSGTSGSGGSSSSSGGYSSYSYYP